MSKAVDTADEARCSVCQVRSALLERMRLTDHLQAQAELSATICEQIGKTSKTKEARDLLDKAAAEIRRMLGHGGI
jgi:hypothetical protein